jgi:NAD(P)-dependent dehydrogenase (short-subunit alcohol dehydrogenase family)
MQIEGKVAIVTGAAGGIGRALAEALAEEGAQVVLGDVDASRLDGTVAELREHYGDRVTGTGGDVARETGVRRLVKTAHEAFGPVDIFCANAGVGVGAGLADDHEWDLAFDVNIRAHITAAQILVPEWLERGSGCFVATASAAGLLTQIGSAPYSVTKHAAVGFAEWLSVTYGDRGLQVHCLCPMGVNTRMLEDGGNRDGIDAAGARQVRAAGAVLEPPEVAQRVLEAIRDGHFLVLPHPEVLGFFQRKAADYDRWLAGMRRLQARVV